jgi:DNA-binding NarL/FixJ family response regulator
MNKKKPAAGAGATQSGKRILIIDDHAIVRQGLVHLINQEKDFTVCGDVDDALKGMAAIDRLKPDLVMVDISLPGMNGIEFIKNAKARNPDLPVLVLSMHDESLYAERSLRAGALGYVMKGAKSGEIMAALRKALRGEIYTSAKVGMALLQKSLGNQPTQSVSLVSVLSDRELEVFELIGKGKTTREIAGVLNLSIKTVDSHRMHIKEKLGITTATELVRHAVHHVGNVTAP